MFRPCLEHGKNVGKMEELSSYMFIHYSCIWNKGISSSRSGGKASRPILLDERKHEINLSINIFKLDICIKLYVQMPLLTIW
jgi:hypothetical protein